ncbi:MAG: M50 family metallopeptidase [Deltaproteobacteria bacterium]|nr:M50 family metallopeptidase [Deltaproteobacteria bacterium]
MEAREKRALRRRALVIAMIASLILWNLPFGGFVLYPFKLFATWLHEMSHGLTMMVVGAGFDHLEIYRDSSGLAYGSRSVGAAANATIASAGYVGTAAFGAAFLILGQGQRGARSILGSLAAALAISALLWVQGTFAIVAVLVAAAVFAGLAYFGTEKVAAFAVNFVAAQSCANAILDIRVLFRSNLVVGGEVVQSDAHSMAQATFGTPALWATVWLVWSMALFFVALRIIYVRERNEVLASASPMPAAGTGSAGKV